MATSAIQASTRYFDVGTTKIYFLPAVASGSLIPTRAEMNAGTDLSPEVAEVDGWSVASEQIETPDFGTRFVSQIPGRISAEDSSLTMYSDQEGDDVRELLPRDTTGYIMWLDGGDTAGNRADVYPVKVTSLSKMRSAEKNAAMIKVSFAITADPGEDVTVPAP
jgi:hypothetical protein